MRVLLARVRRVLISAAVILVFLVLAGATYQGAATALERRQFPHPGRLVDIGGHQLHLHCIGQGAPTVVLEAPATGMSAAWGWVQPDVAQLTRVCTYDRSGLGWSEAGDSGYDPAAVPDELHALLQHASEPGPYVIGGQGLGAALATLYAARYSPEVAGLVLVDPPVTDRPARRSVTRLLNASPWLARTGVLRATRIMSSSAAGLPELCSPAVERLPQPTRSPGPRRIGAGPLGRGGHARGRGAARPGDPGRARRGRRPLSHRAPDRPRARRRGGGGHPVGRRTGAASAPEALGG